MSIKLKENYFIYLMKLLHIIEIRGVGGAEKLLLDFLPALKSKNIDVNCIIIFKLNYHKIAVDLGNKLLDNGIYIKYVQYYNFIGLFKLIFKVKFLIKFIEPDIIHTHLRISEFIIFILKKIDLKTPVVTTIHGFSDNLQFSNLKAFFLRMLFKDFNGLCFISKYMHEFFSSYNLLGRKNKIAIINNGYKINKDSVLNSNHIVDKSNIKLILVGRLVEWKGHKYAIEAIKFLKNRYKNIKLDFYGLGPFEDNLKKIIQVNSLENYISFKGFVDDINAIIPNYDIILVPSINEPFGMVFLDAFSCGVPVVAFDLPAANEIIINNFNGILVSADKKNDLSPTIESLINDTHLYNKIRINGFQTLKHNYNIENIAIKYANFYSSILNTIKFY